ncbi:MAG: 30S ribosomal protein S12 methylthiotransferase RimO [Thermoguttaceae bacterium]|nr:30S ribosomal protein S12 methylthiotransferase RimO [Thermoguttaceae bacterium]
MPEPSPKVQLMRRIHPKRKTFAMICLGCPKNLVDAERIAGLLTEAGWKIVREPRDAQCVIVNTCGFLQASRDEAKQHIEQMLKYKHNGELLHVVITGCYAERDKTLLYEIFPGIDAVVGVTGREQIVSVVESLVSPHLSSNEYEPSVLPKFDTGTNDKSFHQDESHFLRSGRFHGAEYPCPLRDDHRYRLTPRHVAYLKIADGCDRRCAYCAIPAIRGPHASKPIPQVVSEAKELVASGTRELVLIAQDLTYYGFDWQDTDGTRRSRLADLLAELETIPELKWIRLMYLYPMHVTDELIERIATSQKIVPYIDIPLQHADDTVLRKMNRMVNREKTEALLTKLRANIPNLALRTTMMVGFPGETETAFETLCDFIRRWKFEHLGTFVFSPEANTPAMSIPQDEWIAPSVAQARLERLMNIQREITYDWNESQVGKQLEVILDAAIRGEKNTWIGRTATDAPEIDGVVYVTGASSGPKLHMGKMVRCEIVAAQGYDLVAVPVE